MASVKRIPNSPYWIAAFRNANGQRTSRSTKEIDKRKAKQIADQYENAAHNARLGFLAARQARKVIGDIFAISNREPLPNDTVKSFLNDWIKTKKLTAGHKTYVRYLGIVEEFLRWLGPRKEILLALLSSTDIAKFRDHLAKKHSPASVNTALACVQAALEQAFRDNLVDVNEASRVEKMPELPNKPQQRRAFTDDELRSILKLADKEWKGMTLCGAYTGMRLGDVSLLRWQNVDLSSRELRFKTEKTGREMVIPIAEPLHRHLMEIAGNDNPSAPLFPRSFGLRQRDIPTSALSNQFHKILQMAGLVEKRTHKKKKNGPGRSGKRATGGLGFHCLRHSATTLLKRAGASDVIAREIIGHETAAISRTYSHIDIATLRAAIDKLPDLSVE